MNERTRRLCILAVLSALAYITIVLTRIPLMPAAEFLKYDPKDVVVTIGGFIYGPTAAFLMSVVAAFLEMITVGTSGFIGMVMSVVASAGFACTAAVIYRKHHTLKGAVVGLVTGCLMMTGLMILWNYLLTPLYMGYPREAVVGMLLPIILPFNLIKSGINAALTMLLYRPLITLLRRMRLVEASGKSQKGGKITLGVTLVSLLVLATLVLTVLAMKGVL